MYHPIMATGAGSYVQFITVLIIFVVVLGITAMTTKWIALLSEEADGESQYGGYWKPAVLRAINYLQIVRGGGKIYCHRCLQGYRYLFV